MKAAWVRRVLSLPYPSAEPLKPAHKPSRLSITLNCPMSIAVPGGLEEDHPRAQPKSGRHGLPRVSLRLGLQGLRNDMGAQRAGRRSHGGRVP